MTKLSEIIPGEKERAGLALTQLPATVRDFYETQYQDLGSFPAGTFVGLVCRVCGRWRRKGENRHWKDCPVAKLEEGEASNKIEKNEGKRTLEEALTDLASPYFADIGFEDPARWQVLAFILRQMCLSQGVEMDHPAVAYYLTFAGRRAQMELGL